MANKRNLKRGLQNISTALLAECEAMRLYGKANDNDFQSITAAIIGMYGNSVCRVSHPEPGIKPKAYFKDLKIEFIKRTEEIVEQLEALA